LLEGKEWCLVPILRDDNYRPDNYRDDIFAQCIF
jgi:hypothetical protein